MSSKLFKRIFLYGCMAGIYFMGYCKGYNDHRDKNYSFEKIYDKGKQEVLNSVDELADDAYNSMKKFIKNNRGEKNELY